MGGKGPFVLSGAKANECEQGLPLRGVGRSPTSKPGGVIKGVAVPAAPFPRGVRYKACVGGMLPCKAVVLTWGIEIVLHFAVSGCMVRTVKYSGGVA